jgi:hypothetical protein
MAFIACQILGIVGFQIEIKFFFHWLEFLQIWKDVTYNQLIYIR